jgi:hypothetical protein
MTIWGRAMAMLEGQNRGAELDSGREDTDRLFRWRIESRDVVVGAHRAIAESRTLIDEINAALTHSRSALIRTR